jgi:hypothetical protein
LDEDREQNTYSDDGGNTQIEAKPEKKKKKKKLKVDPSAI